MAASSLGHEDLRDFLESINTLSNQIQRSLAVSDPICIEHCKNKLENYISIVAAISVTVNNQSQERLSHDHFLPVKHGLLDAARTFHQDRSTVSGLARRVY